MGGLVRIRRGTRAGLLAAACLGLSSCAWMHAEHNWTLPPSPTSTPAVQAGPGPDQPAAVPKLPLPHAGPVAMGPATGPAMAPATGPAMGPARRMNDVPGNGVVPGDKVVALTFDDGPDPAYTPRVLDALGHFQVTATFFMIGWEAAADPNLVQRIDAAGNGVASHTWNHVDLTRQNSAGLGVQVDRTDNVLASITGRKVSCIRPPQGHYNAPLLSRLAGRGLTSVLWSVDTRDWTRPGTGRIERTALTGLSPGAIILLHDGGGDRSETVQALPSIIEGIRTAGYRLAPICR